MSDWTPYPHHSDPVLFDSRGHRRTGSLFYEASQDKTKGPVFTLKDYDFETPDGTILPSAYSLYMESRDEYDAAMKLVGTMGHWRKLLTCDWFLNGDPDRGIMGLEQWRRDMQARDASEAMRVLRQHVREGDRQAAQYLLNYATKGEQAGVKQSTKKTPKAVRRSDDKSAAPVDLAGTLARLKEGS